jgi:hypothetical protein
LWEAWVQEVCCHPGVFVALYRLMVVYVYVGIS